MKNINNIKLGIFMLGGALCLILGLYYIGSTKNIFHRTMGISATFDDVGGLLPGNNVRFNGINVGTVSSVAIIADTLAKVDFTVNNDVVPYISKNAIASIGTDGLLGSKLINISSRNDGTVIEEGDVINSINSVKMDAVTRTLSSTNENLKEISDNLVEITGKINKSNSLWSVLTDTMLADNVKSAIVNIRIMSDKSALVTGDLKDITNNIKSGKGSLGALITDTTLASKVRQTVVQLNKLSDTTALISGDISAIVRDVKHGKGTMGVLLNDTSVVSQLNESLKKINIGSGLLNEDLKALRESWPFKKYFKKQAKNKK